MPEVARLKYSLRIRLQARKCLFQTFRQTVWKTESQMVLNPLFTSPYPWGCLSHLFTFQPREAWAASKTALVVVGGSDGVVEGCSIIMAVYATRWNTSLPRGNKEATHWWNNLQLTVAFVLPPMIYNDIQCLGKHSSSSENVGKENCLGEGFII